MGNNLIKYCTIAVSVVAVHQVIMKLKKLPFNNNTHRSRDECKDGGRVGTHCYYTVFPYGNALIHCYGCAACFEIYFLIMIITVSQ